MSTPLDLEELRRVAEAATPGPWAWMGNQHGIYLATTHSGRRYVLGFRRMGTQGAQPAFIVNDRIVPAADLVEFEVGDGTARGFAAGKADESVYRYDVKAIDAPDARFLAALNPTTVLALLDRLQAKDGWRDLLREVRDACLYAEDDGQIGITSEPHISEDLFARINAAVKAPPAPGSTTEGKLAWRLVSRRYEPETYGAETPRGLYRVVTDEDSAAGAVLAEWAADHSHFGSTAATLLGRYGSFEEAKAAVQADFEARVGPGSTTEGESGEAIFARDLKEAQQDPEWLAKWSGPAPATSSTDRVREALDRVTGLLETWAADHPEERTSEIDAAIYCARQAALSAPTPGDEEARKRTLTLNLTVEEMAALEALAAKKDVSKDRIFRQALKFYQLKDFEADHGPIPSGPLGVVPPPAQGDWIGRVNRMGAALDEIASSPLPDQPASAGGTEYEWACRHIAKLRKLALDGLGCELGQYTPQATDERPTPGEVNKALVEAIPADLAQVIVQIGEAEWGATAPLSAEEHAAHVRKSVEITAQQFEQDGPQAMNGLYVAGSGTVICHTGTSPNSPAIARALTGAWNRLVAEARTALSQAEDERHG